MKSLVLLIVIGTMMALMFGCTPDPAAAPLPTATPPPTGTQIPATATPAHPATPTPVPQATTSVPPDPSPPEPGTLLLSAPGLYELGIRSFSFDDASRGDRHISITVWYPADPSQNSGATVPVNNAPANPSGAPYPLILTSTKSGRIFGQHLVSHGFVVVGINGMKPSNWWGEWLIDYPLDIVFVLDQIASHPLEDLEGMIDADHAGAIGFSFGGYNALALSGARVDPEFYRSQCATAPNMDPPPAEWWVRYICEMESNWEAFAAHAGEAITTSDDGLWQPMTDDRIRAVMPMAPEGAWLFGERGLAAVDRPTLIISATLDDLNYYDLEAVFIYEHLGTPDRIMVSFVGEDHMVIYQEDRLAQMQHFAAAFFGFHLQGREEYAEYFSEAFVGQVDGLAWGVYAGD